MASRIVGLLLADVGIGCVYTPSPLATPAPPAEPKPKPPKQARPRTRKVTPEVSAYIRNAHGQPVPDIVDQVELRFGVQIARGTVYKEWQSAQLARAQGTPTPAQAAFS